MLGFKQLRLNVGWQRRNFSTRNRPHRVPRCHNEGEDKGEEEKTPPLEEEHLAGTGIRVATEETERQGTAKQRGHPKAHRRTQGLRGGELDLTYAYFYLRVHKVIACTLR